VLPAGYRERMEQTGFARRISRHLGRPVQAACAARPPGSTLAIALGAGLGAGIGSIVGGSPIFAAIGGGLGVVVGYLILWLTIRGSGRSLGMALVLEDDRVDLLQMSPLGSRPVGTLRSIPYADVAGVDANDRFLEVRIVIRTNHDAVELTGGKRGVGAAPPVIEELRRRIA
jgi:hypothetical protein